MSAAPALERGLQIMKYVARKGLVAITDLEKELAIPRASLNRFLAVLFDNQVLVMDQRTKLIKMGLGLTEIVYSAYENEPLVVAVKPVLRRLAQKWNQTFVLYQYCDPFQVVWRAVEERAIKTMVPGWTIGKLNMNAQGQLFLAMLDDDRIAEFVKAGNCHQATEFSLMSYEQLMERVQQIRKKGYAYQERENNMAMKQLAVTYNVKEEPGRYVLGCYLPVQFDEVEPLRDDMILEGEKSVGGE